jgi:hypothetical protein
MCLTESACNAMPKSEKAASSFFFILSFPHYLYDLVKNQLARLLLLPLLVFPSFWP